MLYPGKVVGREGEHTDRPETHRESVFKGMEGQGNDDQWS